jgi:hypothetical protein
MTTSWRDADDNYRTRSKIRFNTRKHHILAGYKKCLREIEWVRQEPNERWWWHSIGSRPTQEVIYAYIIILNKIRYRANIVAWEPGGQKEFGDGRKLTAKHWLQLAHFEPARIALPMKGFQGFRYTKKIF